MSTRPPRGRQKPRREQAPASPLKVVVRRLPPNLPENIFHTSIAAWHKSIDWSEYVSGKLAASRVETDTFSRAYLKFRKQPDCADFLKRYQGHPYISSEGREYRACVEIAPFQKVPRPMSNAVRAKDTLSGTIEQDPDYLAFVESLKTIVPHEKEDLVVATKITPLIEHLRLQKAKQDAKAKARKAKESAAKTKEQEEKRKQVQSQANAATSQMREKAAATNAKGKAVKEPVTNKHEQPSTGKKGQKQSKLKPHDSVSKAQSTSNGSSSSNPKFKLQESSTKSPSTPNGSASSASSAKKQYVPPIVTNPSSLAQQRAPKNRGSSENNTIRPPDAKSSKPRRPKKKDTPKTAQRKEHGAVDISGPTPAEMAALAKGKT